MKLLVLSDSHNALTFMLDAVGREEPDMVIHLGDYARDTLAIRARFPDMPLRYVRGNCDFNADCADMEMLEVCGRKVFITHGHLYGVKNGLDRITRFGASADADLVLFGHTHRAYIAKSGTMTIMNPGAAGGRAGERGKTYGVAHVDEAGVQCKIL